MKDINTENQIYYVFIGRIRKWKSEFCTDCYLQDVADMNDLDPSLTPIYEEFY